MRTVEEIREEIVKVEKANKAAARKKKRCKDRLEELYDELWASEKEEISNGCKE